MVCMALFGAAAADDVIGKLVSLWFPITIFVAVGLEHSIANMCYLSYGLMLGTPGTNVGICLYNNLLPATLGNIVGGSVFMGGAIYLLYIHTGEVEARGKHAAVVVSEHIRERTEQSHQKLVAPGAAFLKQQDVETPAFDAAAVPAGTVSSGGDSAQGSTPPMPAHLYSPKPVLKELDTDRV
jgi:hypothetical protein